MGSTLSSWSWSLFVVSATMEKREKLASVYKASLALAAVFFTTRHHAVYCSSFAALLALLTAPTTTSQTANGLTKNRYIKDRGRSEAASLLSLRKKCHFFYTQSWFSKAERQICANDFCFFVFQLQYSRSVFTMQLNI